MTLDDRFAELLGDLSGFYRSWLVYLGLEQRLIHVLSAAGDAGLGAADVARRAGCAAGPVDGWLRAAYAYRIAEITSDVDESGPRFRIDPELMAVLLDESLPEYLGGQFSFSVGASLEHDGMTEFFRTGEPHAERTPRFHRAVEKLNAQDTVVFMEQGLPRLGEAVEVLRRGGRALDIACGGAGWLVAMARAFPDAELSGIDFDGDWLARAEARVVDEHLTERITVEAGEPARLEWRGRFDFAYLQDVLHELPDPVATLRGAWRALRGDGTLAVFDWCMPDDLRDSRSAHGELLWGYQMDELYQGTSLLTRQQFRSLFADASLPEPQLMELEAGATLFVVRVPPGGH